MKKSHFSKIFEQYREIESVINSSEKIKDEYKPLRIVSILSNTINRKLKFSLHCLTAKTGVYFTVQVTEDLKELELKSIQ